MSPSDRKRLSTVLLSVGSVAAAASLAGALLAPESFFPAYLVAIGSWSTVPIGCLPILMTGALIRGRWAELLRPTLERGVAMLPMTGFLFLPVLLGLRWIFPWARDSEAIGPGAFRAAWLSPGFFVARTVLYLVIYAGLGWALARARSGAARTRIACGGLIGYALLATLAAADWLLSVEPRFHSSIYGLLLVGQQLLAGLAFGLLGALWTGPGQADRERLPKSGLGPLFLAVILLWVYLHAMQFIVVWSGNIPVEADWYLRRTKEGWGVTLVLVACAQGLVPFLLLLLPSMRRSRIALTLLAGLTLLLRPVETVWFILPAEPARAGSPLWILSSLVAVACFSAASMTLWPQPRRQDEYIVRV